MGERLGQHFLRNQIKLGKIAEAVDLESCDVVVEIGPGHGELTEAVIARLQDLKIKNYKMILIEKDKNLAEFLKNKFKEEKNIEIIKGDALEEIKSQSASWRIKIKNRNKKSDIIGNLKIVGNIPYYITGYLLRIIGNLKYKPKLVVFTIQKEVAERICVSAPKMNLLAASVQVWAKPKIVLKLPKGDFNPSPKVDSATLKLTTHNLQPTTEELRHYFKFIKILFKQPRKTILNNLRHMTDNQRILEDKIKLVGVDPNMRPQDLKLEKIMKLSRLISL
ncbi:MAG: 16S rRNA (adenine(1518)-N(6)/adenine(1519)-N(6))-dimethyltransferase RsmA [Patescibacteria group bacterium]|nr:16S rRNA (adenine(1518)-N(6)/adenine(1519)-N(6))-dimethyltransferase RsmA [Patescibacteria group bacterium]